MPIVGYARVSSIDQSHDTQLDRLAAAGCEKIFSEKQSGADAGRPQLSECLRYLREGDTLLITKLDRLARSTVHLGQIAEQLKSDGVGFKVLDQPEIDTTSTMGEFIYSVMAAFAQFERSLIRERQREGIERAKAKGVHLGRPRKITDEMILEMRRLRAKGQSYPKIAQTMDVGTTSVFRALQNE